MRKREEVCEGGWGERYEGRKTCTGRKREEKKVKTFCTYYENHVEEPNPRKEGLLYI